MKKRQVGILIGRMQPPHIGHLKLIKSMIDDCDEVVILLGSSQSSRDTKNPFTWDERCYMILASLESFFGISSFKQHNTGKDDNVKSFYDNNKELCDISFAPIKDYPYSDNRWQYGVQNIIDRLVDTDAEEVVLYGNNKDDSSYYLELFPRWERKEIPFTSHNDEKLSSTLIRDTFVLSKDSCSVSHNILSTQCQLYINAWRNNDSGKRLIKEYEWILKYRAKYEGIPYGVIFQTVDCVVTWRGLVLLGKRKGQCGNGLWALPGGYVNNMEKIKDAAIRELTEEAQPKVFITSKAGKRVRLKFQDSWIESQKTFDHPGRSQRGRIITTAFHVKIPDTFEVLHEAADDLQKTQWFEISEALTQMDYDLFEDHQHIIANLLLRY